MRQSILPYLWTDSYLRRNYTPGELLQNFMVSPQRVARIYNCTLRDALYVFKNRRSLTEIMAYVSPSTLLGIYPFSELAREVLRLKDENIHANRTLTAEQALFLLAPQCRYLEPEGVYSLIGDGFLTVEQALALTWVQFRNLGSESIRALIAGGFLTVEQALALTSHQRRNLEPESIRALIANHTLTLEQALALTSHQRRNLGSESIRALIANHTLTWEQALALTSHQRSNLESASIRALIAGRALTLNRALAVTGDQRRKLESESIRALIAGGFLTGEQALALTWVQCMNLRAKNISALIANHTLTMEQALALTWDQCTNLEYASIRALIANHTLTLDRALALTSDQCMNLGAKHIRALIANHTLTLEQALALTSDQCMKLGAKHISALLANHTLTLEQVLALTGDQRNILEYPRIHALIANHTLTLEQVLALTGDQRLNLEYSSISALIANHTLTLEQAIALTSHQRLNLECPRIRALIANHTLTGEQALALTWDQCRNLESESIRALIANRTLTGEQALALTPDQRSNLESESIRALIAGRVLTLERGLNLTYTERSALSDKDTVTRLIDGDLRIDDILLAPALHRTPALRRARVINDSQSTHNASVHATVSQSASRLAARYQQKICEQGLGNIISKLKEHIDQLDDTTLKHVAAKRCVSRISMPSYNFVDFRSRVPTRVLLALAFLAICDEDSREGTFEDAMLQLTEGLYEIQRGYNLSETGVDDGRERDRYICLAGTFNKLIEKLQSIHPDCEIQLITKMQASLKLPIVVKEEAMRYLRQLSNPNTIEAFQTFTQLISTIKRDVEFTAIWDDIKDNIAHRMFDEFGSLYRNKTDEEFTGPLEMSRLYIEMPDFSVFQACIQRSEGYRQYCSSLHEHRHDSPEAQREYDRHFGLVLRA